MVRSDARKLPFSRTPLVRRGMDVGGQRSDDSPDEDQLCIERTDLTTESPFKEQNLLASESISESQGCTTGA